MSQECNLQSQHQLLPLVRFILAPALHLNDNNLQRIRYVSELLPQVLDLQADVLDVLPQLYNVRLSLLYVAR